MPAVSKISVTLDASKALAKAVQALTKREVLVGVPGGSARKPEPGEKTQPNNAVIAYVQEFGDDEKRIPARPFLLPGVDNAKPEIVEQLAQTGRTVLDDVTSGASNATAAVDRGLTGAGLAGQNAARQKITDGPFAPLSERTIKERAARGRKGAKQYLKLQAQGVPADVLNDPGVGLAKPLIDTGQLRQAVTFVVRDKGQD